MFRFSLVELKSWENIKLYIGQLIQVQFVLIEYFCLCTSKISFLKENLKQV